MKDYLGWQQAMKDKKQWTFVFEKEKEWNLSLMSALLNNLTFILKIVK